MTKLPEKLNTRANKLFKFLILIILIIIFFKIISLYGGKIQVTDYSESIGKITICREYDNVTRTFEFRDKLLHLTTKCFGSLPFYPTNVVLLSNNKILAYNNWNPPLGAALINPVNKTTTILDVDNKDFLNTNGLIDPIKLLDEKILILPNLVYSVKKNNFYLDDSLKKKYTNFFQSRKYSEGNTFKFKTINNRYLLCLGMHKDKFQTLWIEDLVLFKRSKYFNISNLINNVADTNVEFVNNRYLLIYSSLSFFKIDLDNDNLKILDDVGKNYKPGPLQLVKVSDNEFYFHSTKFESSKLYDIDTNKFKSIQCTYDGNEVFKAIVPVDSKYNFILIDGRGENFIYFPNNQDLVPINEWFCNFIKHNKNEVIELGWNSIGNNIFMTPSMTYSQLLKSWTASEEKVKNNK